MKRLLFFSRRSLISFFLILIFFSAQQPVNEYHYIYDISVDGSLLKTKESFAQIKDTIQKLVKQIHYYHLNAVSIIPRKHCHVTVSYFGEDSAYWSTPFFNCSDSVKTELYLGQVKRSKNPNFTKSDIHTAIKKSLGRSYHFEKTIKYHPSIAIKNILILFVRSDNTKFFTSHDSLIKESYDEGKNNYLILIQIGKNNEQDFLRKISKHSLVLSKITMLHSEIDNIIAIISKL